MITFSFSERDYAKIIFVILVAVFVIASVVHIASDTYGNIQNNEVYEQLDKNGGVVYLDIATGSGSLSAQSWYVPQESSVTLSGDCLHIDKAKPYAYSSTTSNIYIPLIAISHIVIYQS